MNNVDEHLEFKMSIEDNRITNYLDLSINRNASSVDLCIYRKPTYEGWNFNSGNYLFTTDTK